MRTSIFVLAAAAYMAGTTQAVSLESTTELDYSYENELLSLAQLQLDDDKSDAARAGLKHVEPNEKPSYSSSNKDNATLTNARAGLKHVEVNTDKPDVSATGKSATLANARTGLKPAGSIKTGKGKSAAQTKDDKSDAARAGLKHVEPNEKPSYSSSNKDNATLTNARAGLKHVEVNADKPDVSATGKSATLANARTGLKPAGSIKTGKGKAAAQTEDDKSDAARAGLKHVEPNEKPSYSSSNKDNATLTNARAGLKHVDVNADKDDVSATGKSATLTNARAGLKHVEVNTDKPDVSATGKSATLANARTGLKPAGSIKTGKGKAAAQTCANI